MTGSYDKTLHPRDLEGGNMLKTMEGCLSRLGQPFRAFLLAQQWGGEYKRIAADHDIIAQVNDMTSVRAVTDIRTLEIL